MRFYRDEEEAKRLPVLRRVLSQHVEEGYRLIDPAGRLTLTIEYVEWVDNHPAGADTHVAAYFGPGDGIEFPFDVEVVMVWHADVHRVSDDDLVSAIPVRWGHAPTPY